MVLFLVVASNVFGAVFTKLGTASVITDALVGLPLPDIWKLALIMVTNRPFGLSFERRALRRPRGSPLHLIDRLVGKLRGAQPSLAVQMHA